MTPSLRGGAADEAIQNDPRLPRYARHGAILIAFSGGIDSTVLLHKLTHEYPKEQLRAIHINHALYPESDAWQQHCEKTCAEYGIPLICVTLTEQPPAGVSIEAWARDQRYAIFVQHINESEILVTAQHADDQAETVLLQLLRGAGPKGLSAMAAEKSFGKGMLKRPLLNWSKQDILQYAAEQNLTWVTDHSNHNTQFDRNYLREKIMPVLKDRWPAVAQTISRSAKHCAQEQDLINALLAPIYQEVGGSKPGTLSIKALQQHTQIVQNALIRHWLNNKNFPMPGHKKFEKIFEDLILARPDAQPEIVWGEVCIRRYRNDLYALKLDEIMQLKTGTKKSHQKQGIPPWERA